MIDLNTIWFILISILIIGYSILDGFDLGVGIIHLFTKDENEKRININAIGPVWDGNEVWLITAGGALFAAFPVVYATVFSSFYLALMILLTALILRAVSFEFRGKIISDTYKKIWDNAFGIGSLLIAVLLSVAYGNILKGIPINEYGIYSGTFLSLLNPYALIIGLTGVSLFIMHGAIYMTMKTEGKQLQRMIKWATGGWMTFIVLYIIATFFTFFYSSYLFEGMNKNYLFWILFLLLLVSLFYIPFGLKSQKYFLTFLASSLTIASAFGISAVSLYPRLVPSSIDLNFSLTAYNASSSQYTLNTMLIIALIGMPIVIAYTIFIYRVFKGKVIISKDSY
ncbi:MAG: cytochrome d ubiquinol oxidase subunit II [Melioribacter sp.]|uniref:cytochrome d ubiquinol oxidase subunit II n=1 Tax=Rosettibacter primus TaxID=3111523 RepID=UPI00247BB21A|nr:cytochrome d ubiquinol oxidase subunit II [Melioribacter sp.]